MKDIGVNGTIDVEQAVRRIMAASKPLGWWDFGKDRKGADGYDRLRSGVFKFTGKVVGKLSRSSSQRSAVCALSESWRRLRPRGAFLCSRTGSGCFPCYVSRTTNPKCLC
jgi:hypothetical protein